LFLIAVITALLPLFAETAKPEIALPAIRVEHTRHPDHESGPATRRCPDGNRPFMLYKSKSEATFYILCQIQEDGKWKGKWSLRAISKDAKGWFERSAYVPKDGSWNWVSKYVEGFATRWKQPLP
jgi:hypothetical protein